MSSPSSEPKSPGDSKVFLFFDGLEIIYFKSVDGGKPIGVVLLPKRIEHTPSLDIIRIATNGTTPIPHGLDISGGITIDLTPPTGAGVRPKDKSFDHILNLQSEISHDHNLEFRKGLPDKPIRVEINEGAFFSSMLTGRFPFRFEVSTPKSDRDIPPFADIVGAEIELGSDSKVAITARNDEVTLDYEPGAIYCVIIKNSPIPGHHSNLGSHSNPDHPEVTHFYLYYDLLNDPRGFQFDLDGRKSLNGNGVPPQNCDPVILNPPPAER